MKSSVGKEGKCRVQLNFTRKTIALIDALRLESGASSRAEVIRLSIRVAKACYEAMSAGGKILLVPGEGIVIEDADGTRGFILLPG